MAVNATMKVTAMQLGVCCR